MDCPGHDILMATMLNGAAVMDAALLLIAGIIFNKHNKTSDIMKIELQGMSHVLNLRPVSIWLQ